MTAVAVKPASARCELVVARVRHRQRGPRRQDLEVALGAGLPQRQVVIPWFHQLRRRDVVVVHDQRLAAAGEPGRHRGGGGELVDDDVTRFGQLPVGQDGQGVLGGFVLDDVDEDVRAEASGSGRIS